MSLHKIFQTVERRSRSEGEGAVLECSRSQASTAARERAKAPSIFFPSAGVSGTAA